MTTRLGFILLAASGMLAFDAPAQAQDIRNPYVFTVADGNNAGRTRIGNNGRERNGDNYQAGNEHATLAQLGDG
ncbi:MAG: hypothetical protein MJE77_43160, partial [Proteobacteria bacterium]|nr:hypothetical protein [Pseudomonadota bacterium]